MEEFGEISIVLISILSGDLVVNDEDEEEMDFKTLDIEFSNENDESEINEKDEETDTDNPITNETKELL